MTEEQIQILNLIEKQLTLEEKVEDLIDRIQQLEENKGSVNMPITPQQIEEGMK